MVPHLTACSLHSSKSRKCQILSGHRRAYAFISGFYDAEEVSHVLPSILALSMENPGSPPLYKLRRLVSCHEDYFVPY